MDSRLTPVLVFVQSLYIDDLTELVTWFHAMDHTNYIRTLDSGFSARHGLTDHYASINSQGNSCRQFHHAENEQKTSRTQLPSKETEVQWVSLTTQARYDHRGWQTHWTVSG